MMCTWCVYISAYVSYRQFNDISIRVMHYVLHSPITVNLNTRNCFTLLCDTKMNKNLCSIFKYRYICHAVYKII